MSFGLTSFTRVVIVLGGTTASQFPLGTFPDIAVPSI